MQPGASHWKLDGVLVKEADASELCEHDGIDVLLDEIESDAFVLIPFIF